MSTKKKHGSPNVQTQSSKRKKTEAEFSSALGSIEHRTRVESPPMLTNGVPLHRCEHCQDLVFDFGQSDDDVRRIVRSVVDDESLWEEYTDLALTWKHDHLDDGYRSAFLNITIHQIRLGWSHNCEVYKHTFKRLHFLGKQKYPLFGVWFNGMESSLLFWRIKKNDPFPLEKVLIYVAEDSPLAMTVTRRVVNADIWSDNSKSQIKHWMEDCCENHILCRFEQEDFRPSNLIEISKDPGEVTGFSLRLTHSFESIPRYAALSYCWGGDQSLKTRKSNINEFREAIPYNKMPATLQDAARVAFELGFRYLWIDSLCLVQDLGTDEIHTLIAEIPEVYRHAVLTIAAHSSPGADHGFLHRRSIPETREMQSVLCAPQRFHEAQIRVENLHGDSGKVMLSLYVYHPFEAPINRRGWTLQERVLSKRYLLFSDLFTQWFCRDSCNRRKLLADGFHTSWSDYNDKALRDLSHQWISRKPLGERKEQANCEAWHFAVIDYTRRTLGVIQDRPIAISALAKDFGEAQDYAAGLWLSNLCEDLCWFGWLNYGSCNVEVGDAFYAPTWSWWSIRYEVNYHNEVFRRCQHDSRFKLLDHTLKLAHPSAPFGYISEASLRIEACYAPATVCYADWDRDPQGVILYGSSGNLHYGPNTHIRIHWDYRTSIDLPKPSPVLLIPLLYSDDSPKYCLIVTHCPGKTTKEPRYYRLGALAFSKIFAIDDHPPEFYEHERLRFAEWLEEQPVETLTLV